jgi:16S rRNA (guanine527-N7)-methyltransferase
VNELFGRYLDLLLEANQRMNLTSVTERAAAEQMHVGDALSLLPFLPAGKITIADIGSGGGCPGIPLAIERRDAKVTLIESIKKKAAFLESVAKELKLDNVRVEARRAEEIVNKFDVVVARAVGPMSVLAEIGLPLVKPGGKLLAMKGPKAAAELVEARKLIARLRGNGPIVHPAPRVGGEGHVIVEIVRRGG